MVGYIQSIEREKSTTKITVPVKNLIQTDGEVNSFSEKQNVREFKQTNKKRIQKNTKVAVQQMLKGLI